MSQKTKMWIYFIFTFGIGYLIAKRKAKAIQGKTNEEIVTTTANNFNVDKLITALGGLNNIVAVQSTISNLKITLKDVKAVSQGTIKNLGAKGSFLNEDKITILFGDTSKDIANKINSKIR